MGRRALNICDGCGRWGLKVIEQRGAKVLAKCEHCGRYKESRSAYFLRAVLKKKGKKKA